METSFRERTSTLGRVTLALLLLIAAVTSAVWSNSFAGSAQDEEDDVETDATIRVVHASPGAPDIDVLIDGQPLVEGIPYGTASDYVAVSSDEVQLQVVPSGQTADAAIIDEEFDADSGSAYILVVRGLLNDLESEIYDVDLDAIEGGQARVRLIHASPDAESVDVVVTGGDNLFAGVDFGDASAYENIDPGTLSLDIKGDEDRTLATVPDLTIEAGKVYDIVALGQISDQSLTLLPLVTSVSAPCAEVLGLEGTAEDACLRVVHAAADAGDVDIYVNDSVVVDGLAFGVATEYVFGPAGDDRTIKVTAAGGSVDEPLIDEQVDLAAGQAYEVIATGEGDDLEATVAEVNLTPLPEGQARGRFIHASPDAENIDIGVAEGETIFEDVEYREVSNYAPLDAGDYLLEVRPAGEGTIALELDLPVEAGITYDAIAIGRMDDQSLELLILESRAAVREGEIATPGAEVMTTPEAVGTTEAVGTIVTEDADSDLADATSDAASAIDDAATDISDASSELADDASTTIDDAQTDLADAVSDSDAVPTALP